MKKIITILIFSVFATASAQSYTQDTLGLHNYRYSMGADIGWFDGIMLKIQIKNNLYLQADVGMGLFFNFLALPISPSLTCDLGGQLNLLYEKKFPKRTNTYWIAGGGIYYAAVSPDGNTKKVNTMKGGIKAILGIEYFVGERLPLSLQVDMRIGYNILYSPNNSYRGEFIPSDNPYHYFDYGFVFSIRYYFGKKN